MSKLEYIYHYSDQKFPELKTRSQQGIESTYPGISKSYNRTMSFFLEAIGEGARIMKENNNARWQQDELFEHKISISSLRDSIDKDSDLKIRSSDEELAFISRHWSKETYKMSDKQFMSYKAEYQAKLFKKLKKEGLIFSNVDELVASDKIVEIRKGQLQAFIDAENHEYYSNEQYASVIPHMIVTLDKPLKVFSITQLHV